MGDMERLKTRSAKAIQPPNIRSTVEAQKATTDPIDSRNSSRTCGNLKEKRLEFEGYVRSGLMSVREAVDDLVYFAKENGMHHALPWQTNELKKLATNADERVYIDSIIAQAAKVLPADKLPLLTKNIQEATAVSIQLEQQLKSEKSSSLPDTVQNTSLHLPSIATNPVVFDPLSSADQIQSNINSISDPDRVVPNDHQSVPQNGLLSSILYRAMQIADEQAQRFLGLIDLGLSAVAPETKSDINLDSPKIGSYEHKEAFPEIKSDIIISEKPALVGNHVVENPVLYTKFEPEPVVTTKTIEPLQVPPTKASERSQTIIIRPISLAISDQVPAPNHLVGQGKKLFFVSKEEPEARAITTMEDSSNITKRKRSKAVTAKSINIKKSKATKSTPVLRVKHQKALLVKPKDNRKIRILPLPNITQTKKTPFPKGEQKNKLVASPSRSKVHVEKMKNDTPPKKKEPAKIDFKGSKKPLKQPAPKVELKEDKKPIKRTLKDDERIIKNSLDKRKQSEKREKEKRALSDRIKAILLRRSKKAKKT